MAATFQPEGRELDDKAASMFPLFASEGSNQLDSKQLMTALTEIGALHGVGRQRLGELTQKPCIYRHGHYTESVKTQTFPQSLSG